MTPTIAPERTTLYYRQGSSDKIYQAAIEPAGTGFVVTFAYGRRGNTLQRGTKTSAPVPYERAKTIFDQLVREKTAKGYTPGQEGTPYQQTDKADRVTAVQPQLLNPVSEADAERLLSDPAWWMQEKFDGRRLLIRKRGAEVVGINRSGLLVGMPLPILQGVLGMASAESCILDGEAVGDVYHVFDLLERDGQDLRSLPYAQRYTLAVDLADGCVSNAIRYAPMALETQTKRSLLRQLQVDRKEGAVFKRHDAPYTPGRPAHGGTQLKLKFTATCSCIVAGSHSSRRSVRLELLEGSRRVSVGNVTIPVNQPVPSPGQVIEVRYLYAFPGGALYQPLYLALREDIDREDCQLSQLKYRPEGESEEDPKAA